jgi:cell division protease FtsH
MERYRRYGRWLKRAAFFLILYVAIGYFFMDVSPRQALLDPGATLSNYRQLIVQLIFVMSFLVMQFVALFWFLARGNSYVIYPGEYDMSFDDVRGQDAAVSSTKEVLRLFQGFKDFKQMGGYPPHGILFEGPPGTGKTLMAKAIAGASGVPFLYATGSGFSNMFMGVGNMKVRRLFTKARNMSDKYGGAVIFIDELDAVGATRGAVSENSREDRSTDRVVMGGLAGGGMGIVNELLVQMDGLIVPRGIWRHVRRIVFRARPKVPFYNVMIIGATNRASTLDRALLRPGRFDRKIHVGLPNYDGRADIAQYYLAKVRHEPIDLKKLARMTMAYSPAQIKNLVNEALIYALQDGRDALRWDDLWHAKLAEEIGLKQTAVYTPREKEMVAVHEAAHAVAAYALRREEQQIQVITIQKREGALGLVSRQPLEETYLATQKQVLADIQISLAGLVSETIWFGQSTSGPSSDLQAATFNAARYVGTFGMGRSLISAAWDATDIESAVSATLKDRTRREEINALLDDCRDRVRNLLLKKRHVVEGIRDALLEREELVGDEIEVLMAELGEREPIEIPLPVPAGAPWADPPGGNGQGGNGQGTVAPPPPPSP